ncbi:MAG: tetratricopeptide repeat protein, partial [Anaerolineae bacterium]|nr:tetratricopeptide repeat protein [Anaerolineae bacterium]
MAKISLRAYIHEIDALIDRGQIDAAIDHCKYILKRYPKHIETYRSLGKAYLENRRYTEATDILTRLLAVVPDDYIAHIGMSIIREDEGNLDAAIFHMERAFEIQPSNQAIQEELKRLYGRRDGVEPSKIRLTRSALVRMYARGELYTQAVAEAKVALAEDPQRIDIELLLARMLFLAGQKTSAEQVCQRILEKLPYCFEANEILAKIYSQAKQSENAKRHQDIVNALEPYYAFISEKAPSPAQVPENAVTLEHLDWKPSQETGQQPEWAKTIGVNVQGGQDNIPDWMIAKPDTDTSSPETASPFYEESLGETPGFEEQITPFTEETNLPEWISSLQPEEATLPAAEPAETGETPEWLASLQTEEPALPAAEPAETGETPEWLASLQTEEPALPASEPAETGETPDWLASLQTEEPALPAAEPAETGETPDWLASLQTEEPALPASEPAETGETPDWLAALQPEEAAQPIEEPAEADLQEMPVPLQTELPDW